MAFTKIQNSDFNDYGALSMSNRPSETKSAQQIKTLFDAPARQVVAPAYNRLIDELEDTTGAASLGATAPTGRSGQTVQAVINDISSDLATLEAGLGPAIEDAHTHENKSVLDKFGENSQGKPTYDGNPIGGGSGSGDMSEADYDPEGNVKTAGGIEDYVEGAISGKADSADLATVATSGSYSDLSNKPDLDGWTSEVTVSSSQAVFDNLDDSLGYKLVAEDTLVGITGQSKTTGTETGTVKITYTLVGATNGTTKCKLRILR